MIVELCKNCISLTAVEKLLELYLRLTLLTKPLYLYYTLMLVIKTILCQINVRKMKMITFLRMFKYLS